MLDHLTTQAIRLRHALTPHPVRTSRERGLSQSTENAILLAGAVTIALIVISAITAYVTKHLPN
ncbi:MAG TPA: hypothetical protein VHO26_10630 [Propionibacteriaceae bacterium]|nr:hypothetical protein [Propionibacteriaceae bacterium]